MRALVTGAAGQVGREVVTLLAERGHDVVAATRAELDVRDRDVVLAAMHDVAPDVVVHTATWTAVDDCEADPDRAFAVNALGTRHVAEAARRTGSHLVVVSSDYVFDGTADRPYTEWDEPNPVSVYGRSLLAREREAGPDATVVRTSWVSGRHGSNFVKTMLRLAGGDGELRVVDDQHGCPTEASDLASVLVRFAVERRPGTFHVTNQVPTTWFELARLVLDAAGHDPGRVVPVATAALEPPRPAPRPAYSVLDGLAMRAAGVPLLPDHDERFRSLVKELTA